MPAEGHPPPSAYRTLRPTHSCPPPRRASKRHPHHPRISTQRTDHIGRPVFATNTSGVKVWTATPARAGLRGRSSGKQSTGLFSDPPHPFGGVRTTTGTPINARFPGQWFQSESGLHQNWMRDYDPTTGRYLQADPLGLVDGASVFGYARQSPMTNVDPRGEQTLSLPSGPLGGGGPVLGVRPGTQLGDRLGQSLRDDIFPLFDPRPLFEACLYLLDPLGYQVYQNTGPYTGETPNDAPQDFTRHGPSGGLRGADGSIWKKDRTRHGGSEWKRWPNEKDWERDRNRESVRPNGTIR